MTDLLEYSIDDKMAKEILDFLVRRARCDGFRLLDIIDIENQLCKSFIIIPSMTSSLKTSDFLKCSVNLHWRDSLHGLNGLGTAFLPVSEDMHAKFLSMMLEISKKADIWFFAGHGMTKNFLNKGETLESILMSKDLNESILKSCDY